jgi:putative FmdB family regulatory protein
MPSYLYKCASCGTQQEEQHSMFSGIPIICECGSRMHKIPQATAVNWGGPPPSAGGKHPLVETLNATESQRRDEFTAKKEQHNERTAKSNSHPTG